MRFLTIACVRLQRKQSKLNLCFSFVSFSSSNRLAVETCEKSQVFGEKLDEYTVIKEGEGKILMNSTNSVFYNRAQVNNRDLSIAVLRTFISKRKEEHMLSKKVKLDKREPARTAFASIMQSSSISQGKGPSQDCDLQLNQSLEKPEDVLLEETQKTTSSKGLGEQLRVLEALAASGLRSIRYALEVDGLSQVVALDRDKECVEACMKNLQLNGSVACSKVEVHHTDARLYMLSHPKEFDAILILMEHLLCYWIQQFSHHSAVQSVSDGGMLMCSATDLAVLCGGNQDVCYSKYGSYPLNGKYCHEMALRILLASIESHANRYKRFIVPILSVHMDFYIRVFVRIFTSASEVKNTPLKLSYVYQCVGCDSYFLQSLGRTTAKNNRVRYTPGVGPVVPKECCDCGKKFHMGGPIWSAPIHDQEWVASILENVEAMKEVYPAYEKISAVLRTTSQELLDVPLFLSLHNLCATLKCTVPSDAMFRCAVTNAGYRISGTHTTPLGFKTDAPMTVIWDILRCWVKKHPVRAQLSGQPGTKILSKEPTFQANFSPVVSISKDQGIKGPRFVPNPERHWGPKIRAGRQISSKHASHVFPHRGIDSLHHEQNGKS